MSFRARLISATAVAVAVAVAIASAVVYVVVRSELRSAVDDGLRVRAAQIAPLPLRSGFDEHGNVIVGIPPVGFGDVQGVVQYVTAEGRAARPSSFRGGEAGFALPVRSARAVAAGRRDGVFDDARVDGMHMRILAVHTTQPGIALQVARPLTETDRALHRIAILLLAIASSGIGVAALLGLAVARTALRPVRRLTAATEHVTATGDLTGRLDVTGSRDELSRLGGSFNTMLAALEDSSRAQRQLVSDASHELRTPLTSLRTNIEVLALDRTLPEGERERLLSDVVEQLGEMTALVAELVELARGELPTAEREDVRLDLVAASALERARRDRPHVAWSADLAESTVRGVPGAIERAISNLIDNAGKWSTEGGEVEVAVRDGEVTVRDHGPGIPADDLPRVFDRFYRAPAARGMPGSGLGLAIVKQVAEQHGGSVSAENAADGGARVRLLLPS